MDTAHQQTEALEGGAQIPAGLASEFIEPNRPLPVIKRAQGAMNSGAIATSPVQTSAPSHEAATDLHNIACAIARAAHRLGNLRNTWLNPPEWTQRIPEITPLGMDHSPYPDRILPKDNLSQTEMKELGKRTLTNLYNLRQSGQVQWLQSAHEQLDAAVATAYGWADTPPRCPMKRF